MNIQQLTIIINMNLVKLKYTTHSYHLNILVKMTVYYLSRSANKMIQPKHISYLNLEVKNIYITNIGTQLWQVTWIFGLSTSWLFKKSWLSSIRSKQWKIFELIFRTRRWKSEESKKILHYQNPIIPLSNKYNNVQILQF